MSADLYDLMPAQPLRIDPLKLRHSQRLGAGPKDNKSAGYKKHGSVCTARTNRMQPNNL